MCLEMCEQVEFSKDVMNQQCVANWWTNFFRQVTECTNDTQKLGGSSVTPLEQALISRMELSSLSKNLNLTVFASVIVFMNIIFWYVSENGLFPQLLHLMIVTEH